jgi:hypothetical protein
LAHVNCEGSPRSCCRRSLGRKQQPERRTWLLADTAEGLQDMPKTV